MIYLDKLLAGRPVTWKPLGEVAEIKRGKRVTKRDLASDKPYPVYSGGVSPMGYYDHYNFPADTVTIVKYGSAGFVNFIEEDFWANDVCYCIIPKSGILKRYLYHALLSKQKDIYAVVTDAVPEHLSSEAVKTLSIPIPPRDVQEEIVRVLDRFTELEAELEAELETELEARQKQYAYYRDLLLSFPDDAVTYLPLGEVCEIKNGSSYKHLHEGEIPVYGSGGIMTYVDQYVYDKPTVLIPRKGSLGNLFYLEEPFWNVDTIYYTKIDSSIIIPKLLYYYLQTQHLEEKNNAGGVPSLTQNVLKPIPIPIPPLEEQERIVGILDRFETLAHSISEGLPRELELRRKQYSYYRDLLLTFTPQD